MVLLSAVSVTCVHPWPSNIYTVFSICMYMGMCMHVCMCVWALHIHIHISIYTGSVSLENPDGCTCSPSVGSLRVSRSEGLFDGSQSPQDKAYKCYHSSLKISSSRSPQACTAQFLPLTWDLAFNQTQPHALPIYAPSHCPLPGLSHLLSDSALSHLCAVLQPHFTAVCPHLPRTNILAPACLSQQLCTSVSGFLQPSPS